jgi:hypothetical protein
MINDVKERGTIASRMRGIEGSVVVRPLLVLNHNRRITVLHQLEIQQQASCSAVAVDKRMDFFVSASVSVFPSIALE